MFKGIKSWLKKRKESKLEKQQEMRKKELEERKQKILKLPIYTLNKYVDEVFNRLKERTNPSIFDEIEDKALLKKEKYSKEEEDMLLRELIEANEKLEREVKSKGVLFFKPKNEEHVIGSEFDVFEVALEKALKGEDEIFRKGILNKIIELKKSFEFI